MQGFTLERERLLYKGRFVLPKNSSFIPNILKQYYVSPVGGHGEEHKTYTRIACDWFWEGMKKQIVEYVKKCGICQR